MVFALQQQEGKSLQHLRSAHCWVTTLGSEVCPNFEKESPISTEKLGFCRDPSMGRECVLNNAKHFILQRNLENVKTAMFTCENNEL